LLQVRAIYHRDPEEFARTRDFYMNKQLRVDEGRSGQILKMSQPYVARDLLEDPHLNEADKTILGAGSLIAVPLLLRGRAIGVMFWYRQGRQRPLTEAMVPLTTHLGFQVALAIDNAQLVQDMEQKIAERTATVLADKEALAMQLETGREYVTQLALQMREQVHGVLGMAGLIELELERETPDVVRTQHYLETIMTSAERVNEELEELFGRLRTGEAVSS
jgi:GAF domain-containing protein